MAIDIKETFKIAAPIDKVWNFFLTPDNIVACMPGASLTEIVDALHFTGAVKVKLGAVSAQYQGSITYQEVDKNSYAMKFLAEGNERGGGTATATIVTQLIQLADGSGIEVRCDASIDITGRMAQVGRGMIEGVSAQIIKKYVTNVRVMLERDTEPAAEAGTNLGSAATPPSQPPQKNDSINIVAVVLTVLLNGLRNFFKRLFGGRTPGRHQQPSGHPMAEDVNSVLQAPERRL